MRRTLQRAAAAVLTAALALGGVVALGVAPASAGTASFGGTIDGSDPIVTFCDEPVLTNAEIQPFTVTTTGQYAFQLTNTAAGSDAILDVLADSVCIGSDFSVGPTLRVQLDAGRTYSLRALNFGGVGQISSYVVNASGPGDILLGAPVSASIVPVSPQQEAAPVRFTVTFAEPVTGFDVSDLVLGGVASTPTTIAGTGAVYSVFVSTTGASGPATVSIPAGAATTVDGRPTLAASASATFAPRPSVAVQQSTTQLDPASSLPATFDVRFSEPVTGFVAGDVVLSGTSSPSDVTVSGSGSTYVVSVAGAQRTGSIDVTVPANVAQTSVGAGNLAAIVVDGSVLFAPSAPVATIAPVAASDDSVPMSFAVEFDGAVQGFDASDVVVGGTAGPSGVSLSGSGASYVVSIADAVRAGTVTAQVRGAAVTRYELTNAASATATATFAPPRPTVAIEQSAAQSDPTTEPTAVFDVTFSEAVTGLDAGDLVVGGTAGAATVTLSGSGASYVATVTGATRPGSITLAMGEGAATSRFDEPSLAATSVDASVAFEPRSPTVAVTLADGQDATTTTSSAAFRLTFSEPVTGLEVDDLVVDSTAGGQASIEGSDDGTTFVVRITSLERAGTVTVSVRAGAVENAYGLDNASSEAASVVFAPERPSATVDQAASQADPADVDGIAFDVAFSQPVTGLEPSDLVVGGTAGAAVVELTGDGAAYVAIVSGAARPGTVTLSLPEGAAVGAFEATSLAATSTDAEVTFAPPAPTVTVEQAASQEDPASFGVIVFDVTFSHDVSGLAPESFVVGGTAGATSVQLEGSGSTYRAFVVDMVRPGTVTLGLAADAAVDRYGVRSLAATSVDAEVTFAPPVPMAAITRAEGQAAVTAAQPFVFHVAFSVPVSGLAADDVIVGGDTGATIVEVVPDGTPQSSGDAAAAAVDAAAADELGMDWTVRVSGATGYGVVSIGLREGAVASGYGVESAAVEPSTEGSIVYAPAVVAPAPVAPAPVAPAPTPIAPAPVAALPQTGGEPLWAALVVAMLALAIGGGMRRATRRG